MGGDIKPRGYKVWGVGLAIAWTHIGEGAVANGDGYRSRAPMSSVVCIMLSAYCLACVMHGDVLWRWPVVILNHLSTLSRDVRSHKQGKGCNVRGVGCRVRRWHLGEGVKARGGGAARGDMYPVIMSRCRGAGSSCVLLNFGWGCVRVRVGDES